MRDTPKNTYLTNGHNYQDERLPLYLPGNGGLLHAVAAMVAGWDGAPKRANPGFPANGKWRIRSEGLLPVP
jgi:protein-glucosylgalactosylhydroxylysine glucosidase